MESEARPDKVLVVHVAAEVVCVELWLKTFDVEEYRALDISVMGHSACEFMCSLHIVEIYRCGAIFAAGNIKSIFIHFYTASPSKGLIGYGVMLWSFKVIQGHQNWYQSTAYKRLPISVPV